MPALDNIEQLHPLPEWLTDHTKELVHANENDLPIPDPRFPRTQLEKEVREHNLECLFERILDTVTEGGIATRAIVSDHNGFTPGEVMRWIRSDSKRLQRYREAQKDGSEVIADQMIGIADAENTAEDVQRSTLRIKTRQYVMEKNNKERYGQDPLPSSPFAGGVTIVIGEVTPAKQIGDTFEHNANG